MCGMSLAEPRVGRWGEALVTEPLCAADPFSPQQGPHPASHQPEWRGTVPLGHPEKPPLLGQKGKEELWWAGEGPPPSPPCPGLHHPLPRALASPTCLPRPSLQIAEKVGCPLDDTARMAKCLKVTDPRALTLAYKMPLAGMECEWRLLGAPGGSWSVGGPCSGEERNRQV